MRCGPMAVFAGAWGMKPAGTAIGSHEPERVCFASFLPADEKGRGLVRTAPEAFRPRRRKGGTLFAIGEGDPPTRTLMILAYPDP